MICNLYILLTSKLNLIYFMNILFHCNFEINNEFLQEIKNNCDNDIIKDIINLYYLDMNLSKK